MRCSTACPPLRRRTIFIIRKILAFFAVFRKSGANRTIAALKGPSL